MSDRTEFAPISTSIEEAAEVLRKGGVIAVPTDTIYGVSANALDEGAVEKTFKAKGRREDSPLPVFISSVDDLAQYGRDIPNVAYTLAENFWPGKLTIVVAKSPEIPSVVSGGLDTVGLRIPDHSVPRDIVHLLGSPITGTSANITGHAPATSLEEVVEHLGHRLDLIFDGGALSPSSPSSVLDVTVNPPRLLRQGAVSPDELRRVAGVEVAM